MDKLTTQQKKSLWFYLLADRFGTWEKRAQWATNHFGFLITDEEVSAFYTAQVMRDPV
jgi:hypothetical protein